MHLCCKALINKINKTGWLQYNLQLVGNEWYQLFVLRNHQSFAPNFKDSFFVSNERNYDVPFYCLFIGPVIMSVPDIPSIWKIDLWMALCHLVFLYYNGSSLIRTSVIRTLTNLDSEMTALLGYFVKGVCSIKVVDYNIQWFTNLNKFTRLFSTWEQNCLD